MSTQTQIQITHILLSCIQISPINARKHFDQTALVELSDAIRTMGVLQPIIVRQVGIDRYEIVAGERRYRASILAERTEIPCIIHELSDDEALDIMLMENIQREDLHPIEEANGFKQIMDIKHIDIKELAARVGKTTRYVAQRLKLCDLIEPIQQHFFNGLLLVKDALILSQLRPEDQQEFYDLNLAGDDSMYDLNEWDLNKYQNNLARATFDIHDADLVKGRPACTLCPFNSAAAMLFPDQAVAAICHDASCYRSKCDRAFEIRLTDDDIVQITGQHFSSQKIDKDTQRLIPTLPRFMPFESYTEVDAPEPPFREDFNGDNDTEEEDQADYERVMQEYQAELADINKKVKSGQYIRAFIVGGDRKGQHIYIELNDTPRIKPSPSNGSTDPGDMTADDITAEITSLQDKERAAIRTAEQSRWEEIVQLADPVRYVSAAANQKLSVAELQAIAHGIYRAIDYEFQADFRALFYGSDEGSSIPDGYLKAPHLLSDMLRFFLVATLQPHYIGNDTNKFASKFLENCLAAYNKEAIDDINTMHDARTQERQNQTSARIKALDKKLKSLQSPKKGKGIKALISHCLLIPISCLLLLSSCTTADIISPVSNLVTYDQAGHKLHLQIHTSSPSATVCHDDGRCIEVLSHYYTCISISVDPGETITVSDGVEECHIIIAINQH